MHTDKMLESNVWNHIVEQGKIEVNLLLKKNPTQIVERIPPTALPVNLRTRGNQVGDYAIHSAHVFLGAIFRLPLVSSVSHVGNMVIYANIPGRSHLNPNDAASVLSKNNGHSYDNGRISLSLSIYVRSMTA